MHKLLEAIIGRTHSIEPSFEGIVVKSFNYEEIQFAWLMDCK
jgi:hypothetical protein